MVEVLNSDEGLMQANLDNISQLIDAKSFESFCSHLLSVLCRVDKSTIARIFVQQHVVAHDSQVGANAQSSSGKVPWETRVMLGEKMGKRSSTGVNGNLVSDIFTVES